MVETNIDKALNKLSETDVWSLMLFALWQIQEVPEYATLSELMYVLDDVESVSRFFDYYGGTTIKVPTKEEFKNVVNALLLYQYVNLDKIPFADALKATGVNETKEIKELYLKLVNILSNYDFRRK